MSQRRILVILLISCLLIAYIYFISDYLKQNRLQATLASQVSDASRTLSLIPKPAADLDKRLAEARQANLSLKQKLAPGKVNITQVVDRIYQVGDQLKLKLTPLSTEPWSQQKVGENTYNVSHIKLKLEGGFSDLRGFITRLEDKNTFPYLGLETMTVNGTGELMQVSTEESEVVVNADISVVVFTLVEGSN